MNNFPEIPQQINLVREVDLLSTELTQQRARAEFLQAENGKLRVTAIRVVQELGALDSPAIAALRRAIEEAK